MWSVLSLSAGFSSADSSQSSSLSPSTTATPGISHSSLFVSSIQLSKASSRRGVSLYLFPRCFSTGSLCRRRCFSQRGTVLSLRYSNPLEGSLSLFRCALSSPAKSLSRIAAFRVVSLRDRSYPSTPAAGIFRSLAYSQESLGDSETREHGKWREHSPRFSHSLALRLPRVPGHGTPA